MSAGSVEFTIRGWSIVVVLLLGLSGATAVAQQTSDEACAADSLVLISPDVVDLRLETVGKSGLTISWPNLDLSDGTCFSLSGTDNLGFSVDVGGEFRDRIDRVFRFTIAGDGAVGGATAGNIILKWQTLGGSTNGTLAGDLNLANNGGLWTFGGPAGAPIWSQVNNGLPMIWPRVNVIALDQGVGDFMVATFTKGISLESESVGLYSYNGVNWTRLAADVFDKNVVITSIAISPGDNDSFAVGTKNNGLFVTTDGGENFTQWSSNLPAGGITAPTNFPVSALNWESARLLVYMENWGLFVSENGGASFDRSPILVPSNLDDPAPTMDLPVVLDFAVDPSNADHIVAGLEFHGAYETTDGGDSWHDLNGDLVVPDTTGAPPVVGAWINSALSVVIDDRDPLVIVMGVSQKGLYRTADGGLTWNLVAGGQQPTNVASLQRFALSNRPGGSPGEILALEDGWGLLQSTDSGLTWSRFMPQPAMTRGLTLVMRRDNSGDFTIGTNGGGIYQADSIVELSDTYNTLTTTDLRDLSLGLTVAFGGGVAELGDTFDLVAQTFQGWAVWRGSATTPNDMTLVGLYDRVNPEDCFEGYCGDNSLEIVPLCYAAKRAACFQFLPSLPASPDTIRFFDDEIYNGFSYVYAVTSFDYGNTALTTPENTTSEMLFSPRWSDTDPLSIYPGPGNRVRIDVNKLATAAVSGEEIYAFPNPVRLGAGVPRGLGSLVTFTNLPEGSRVRVFTTAGDDVINLGPDNQIGGQIYWRTVNRDGEDVSAGIYLYKVEMPQREDYWGRIVVIR